MTALALRDDQTFWDDKQIAVLRSTGIDTDVSNAELAAFLHECQLRQLDPFSRQIYLIGRWDKRAGRKVYRSQTSIDGFRLIARRAADRSGIDYAYEDTIWYDDQGNRHEVWLSAKPPAAAKVVVVRNGQRFDAVARYGAYVQTGRDGEPLSLWNTMADTLLAKCAEAQALRKSFPEELGSLYTDDEMNQADNDPQPPLTVVSSSVRVPSQPPVRVAAGMIDASAMSEEEKQAAGLMARSQRVEHNALRRQDEPAPGAVEKLTSPDPDDKWAASPAEGETPRPQPKVATSAAIEKLGKLLVTVPLGTDEDVAVFVAWITGRECPPEELTTGEVRLVTSFIDDALKQEKGDVDQAASYIWQQYRRATGQLDGLPPVPAP